MARKDNEDYDVDNTEFYTDEIEPTTADMELVQEIKHSLVLFDEADDVIDVSAMLDEAGFNAPKISLAQLSNKPFVIRWFNSFNSSYQDGAKVFHCICRDYESGNLFRTIIGCKAGVEILEQAEKIGRRSGLKLTFEYVTGKGKYAGYYIIK